MSTMELRDHLNREAMPCAFCGILLSKEGARTGEGEWESYRCGGCGEELRLYVPLFLFQAPPYGWQWRLKGA